MIINNLIGGLGNQLFQISAGYAHAKKIKTEFAINYNIGLGSGQGHHPNRYKNNLYKNIPSTNRRTFVMYNQEFGYSPIACLDDLCLIGYFQSSKFFRGYEKEIKKLFNFPRPLMDRVKKKMSKIKKKKVGIHLRLGDYHDKSHDGVFIKINYKDYLDKVLLNFDEEYEFLIFSDDLKSLKKKIDIQNFINLKNNDEIEDLFALSQCDEIVMSNSSFSWWGAFLGNEKKRVFCPGKWFGPKGFKNFQDIYEDSWIKIDVKNANL